MSQKLKVLVTEDNEVNQKVIKVILERNGVEYWDGRFFLAKPFKSGDLMTVLKTWSESKGSMQ